MPGSYRILADRGLVYVRYEGRVLLREAEEMFADFMGNPAGNLGLKQLIDLSRVTDWEKDFPKLMAMQADKADAFMTTGHTFFMVFYAPTEKARAMGRVLVAPWKNIPGIVTTMQEDEDAILDILGQPDASIDAILRASV